MLGKQLLFDVVFDGASFLRGACPLCGRIYITRTYLGNVVALDANKKLLDTASELGRTGSLKVVIPSAGGSSVIQQVSLSPEANPGRISFKQCDPMCLPAGMAGEGIE